MIQSIARNEEYITPCAPETLDKLWYEATGLGVIDVDSDYKGTVYTVTIKFYRQSGTTIYAKGADSSIHVAFGIAINEAREMGAGN